LTPRFGGGGAKRTMSNLGYAVIKESARMGAYKNYCRRTLSARRIKMKKKILLCFATIGIVFLFVACVIPEKFTCAINVDKQGAYSVDFKGILLFWAALEDVEKQGKVSAETDRQIKEMFDELIPKEPMIKKYEYRNSGRAYVEYFNKVTDNSTLDLSESFGMPLIISVSQDGTIIITEKAVGGETLQMMSDFVKSGYKMDGVIEITSDLPIIDAGGQKVGRKFLLIGPQVIKQVLTTFPTQDVVIKIKKK
jgi:hypothetical protein